MTENQTGRKNTKYLLQKEKQKKLFPHLKNIKLRMSELLLHLKMNMTR